MRVSSTELVCKERLLDILKIWGDSSLSCKLSLLWMVGWTRRPPEAPSSPCSIIWDYQIPARHNYNWSWLQNKGIKNVFFKANSRKRSDISTSLRTCFLLAFDTKFRINLTFVITTKTCNSKEHCSFKIHLTRSAVLIVITLKQQLILFKSSFLLKVTSYLWQLHVVVLMKDTLRGFDFQKKVKKITTRRLAPFIGLLFWTQQSFF